MNTITIIILSSIGVLLLMIVAYVISKKVGVVQSKNANMFNRHVKSSAKGGQPDNAVGFLSEGNMAILKSEEERFTEPLPKELELLGVTNSDWKYTQEELQKSWKAVGSKDFKKAIDALNHQIFDQHNCIAVYAEYGPKGGQKAMTIYKKDVWNTFKD